MEATAINQYARIYSLHTRAHKEFYTSKHNSSHQNNIFLRYKLHTTTKLKTSYKTKYTHSGKYQTNSYPHNNRSYYDYY